MAGWHVINLFVNKYRVDFCCCLSLSKTLIFILNVPCTFSDSVLLSPEITLKIKVLNFSLSNVFSKAMVLV